MDNLSGYEKVIFENNCEAMILNQYQREYYENYDNRFRVTVDYFITYMINAFAKINLTNKALIQEAIIVEFKFERKNSHFIKNNASIPSFLELAEILNTLIQLEVLAEFSMKVQASNKKIRK